MRVPHNPRVSRAILRDERGITLVELVIAMLILSIVSLVFTTTLTSVQRAVVREDVRTQLNNKARLAIQTIDRQVRSGNLLYDPSTEVVLYASSCPTTCGSGYMFRVYTQANSPTEGARCALWLIDDKQQLKYRWWPALAPNGPTASGWIIVTDGVVNRTIGQPAFSLDSTGRTATINFYINPNYSADKSATQAVTASLTGRNTSFGYPANLCSTLPANLTS